MTDTVSLTVALSREFTEAIDALVGEDGRADYIAEAVAERVLRDQQRAAFERAAGILKDSDHPEWSTPEKISAWVAQLRAEDNRRLEEKLARWGVQFDEGAVEPANDSRE